MKNLLLSLIFICTTFITFAQDAKPTKEETQKFINSLLQKTIGEKYDSYFYIKIQFFSGEQFEIYTFKGDDNEGTSSTNEISLIKWESLFEVNIVPLEDKKLSQVNLLFKSNFQRIFRINNNKPETNYHSWLWLYVPVEKGESVKKAFLRLAEIVKEEDKDPFEK